MKSSEILPDISLLQRLAINDSGFVFDPVSGCSFTLNPSGFALLNLMRRKDNIPEIVQALTEEWDVDSHRAERDLIEFCAEIRKIF